MSTYPIGDDDLLAELEAARGRSGFELIAKAIARKQQERDRLAGIVPARRTLRGRLRAHR